MADPQPKPGTPLQIPADTQTKFGKLVLLIQGSESMNDEERQYWINILPIMTPEQLKNLEEILVTEKEQLAAIEKKYAEQIRTAGATASVVETGEKIRSQSQKRATVEQEAETKESEEESAILEKIRSL